MSPNAPQPAPVPADPKGREAWPLVIRDVEADQLPEGEARTALLADMRERDRIGRERYGVPLSPHNGRDPLVDAYQEALDLVVYLKCAVLEASDTGDRSEGTRYAALLEEYVDALHVAHRIRRLLST